MLKKTMIQLDLSDDGLETSRVTLNPDKIVAIRKDKEGRVLMVVEAGDQSQELEVGHSMEDVLHFLRVIGVSIYDIDKRC